MAAFSILGFVVYGYSMICIGFGQGNSPLVSICWGAEEVDTAMGIRKITNGIAGIYADFAGNTWNDRSVADGTVLGNFDSSCFCIFDLEAKGKDKT